MSANGKYRVIAVDTLEERKRHRAVIEDTLRKIDLSPALRKELQAELIRSLQKEQAARLAVDDAEQEEEREKKKGDGRSDQDGKGGSESGGSTSGSGGSGGGSGGGMGLGEGAESTASGGDFLFADTETLALLFFLNEQVTPEPEPALDNPLERAAPSEAVAAATVSLDHNAGIAHVHEPFVEAPKPVGVAALGVLLSLEQHAARLGARELRLQAHADAVTMLQNKYGYKTQGKVVMRQGVPMQRLAKNLTPNALPTPLVTG